MDQRSLPCEDGSRVEGVEESGRIAGHGAQEARDECQLVCARVCEGLMCCVVTREAAE